MVLYPLDCALACLDSLLLYDVAVRIALCDVAPANRLYSQVRTSLLPILAPLLQLPPQGQLEIMMHRRLTADDARGVAEPLDDTLGIDTTFYLSMLPSSDTEVTTCPPTHS